MILLRTSGARVRLLLSLCLLTSCARGGAEYGICGTGLITLELSCLDPAECRVVGGTDAGADDSGVELHVWETTRGRRDVETRERSDAPGFGACELREFWLERDRQFTLTLALCNDGYGASGVGDDTVSIGPNRIEHTQSGGSAWRWSTHQSIALSPRRLLRESTDGYWAVARNAERRVFDLEAFSGSVAWYAPVCDEDVGDIDEGSIGEVPESLARRYTTLPAVVIDEGFDPARVDPCACATHVDGTEGHGFVLAEGSGVSSASIDVLVGADRRVIVFVRDDVFIAGDVLRVHTSDQTPSYFEHCLAEDARASTVTFDLVTNAAVSDDATSPALVGGQARDGRYVTFTLPNEDLAGGLTIEHADVDAPGGPARVVATSQVREGDAWSLGTRDRTYETRFRCSLAGDALTRVQVDPPVRSPFE